jgi:hypothetical protein
MTVLETERKYQTKTISGEKPSGNNTAKSTLSPPVVSGHSHSIVPSYLNALNFQHKFFLRAAKNRLTDPSEIRALEFKRKFC